MQKNHQNKPTDNEKLKAFKMFLEFSDEITKLQTTSEQAVYLRLLRLTYAVGKETVSVSFGDLKKNVSIRSTLTLSKTLNNLTKKRHIKIIDKGFGRKTTYYVHTPRQITTPDKYDKKS